MTDGSECLSILFGLSLHALVKSVRFVSPYVLESLVESCLTIYDNGVVYMEDDWS